MDYLFQSERLGFRKWKDGDIKPLAELCADPEVMRFFLNPLSYEQSENLLKKLNELFKLHHYGACLLYTSPSPRDRTRSRMPSSA